MKTYALVLTDEHPLIPKDSKLPMFDIGSHGRQYGDKVTGNYWSSDLIESKPKQFKIVTEHTWW